jgi:polyhydroxyalkanoate synthesis regulator phasin
MKDYIAVVVTVTLVLAIFIYLNTKTVIMKQSEMLAELIEINETTTEIGEDIDDIIANGVKDGDINEELAAKFREHTERLRGIAAKHTKEEQPPIE